MAFLRETSPRQLPSVMGYYYLDRFCRMDEFLRIVAMSVRFLGRIAALIFLLLFGAQPPSGPGPLIYGAKKLVRWIRTTRPAWLL